MALDPETSDALLDTVRRFVAERRATFDGQSCRLSGTKRYITNADKADLFIVMARTGDDPGARGVSAFLVPRNPAGVSIGAPEKKIGQKGAKVADVIFDDVVVQGGRAGRKSARRGGRGLHDRDAGARPGGGCTSRRYASAWRND